MRRGLKPSRESRHMPIVMVARWTIMLARCTSNASAGLTSVEVGHPSEVNASTANSLRMGHRPSPTPASMVHRAVSTGMCRAAGLRPLRTAAAQVLVATWLLLFLIYDLPILHPCGLRLQVLDIDSDITRAPVFRYLRADAIIDICCCRFHGHNNTIQEQVVHHR